jgi:hypothetical protein
MHHVIRTYVDGHFKWWEGSHFSRNDERAVRYKTTEIAQRAVLEVKQICRPWIENIQIETRFDRDDDVPSYANSGGN